LTASILVVDDEPVARRVAFRILSEYGFRVFEADRRDEVLQVLREARGRVDLVMLDVVMPSTDGVALAQEILAEWPGQKLLFMSAHPAQILAQHGLRDLNVPFLAKPYTRTEVLAKVIEALSPPRRADSETQRRAD
jgi:DNA-binding NtrC family response regulator